jgi:hypothetical protein
VQSLRRNEGCTHEETLGRGAVSMGLEGDLSWGFSLEPQGGKFLEARQDATFHTGLTWWYLSPE